jgi:hypothetical protein
MHRALEDALLRLERADEHLESLDRERRAFIDQAAGRVLRRFEPQTREHIFYIEGQPPRRWGPILSDFGNQLHSVLDNVVSGLAVHRGGDDSRTTFPIATISHEWKRAKSRGYLAGLSALDREAIKRFQPYIRRESDPDRDPLARLAWLSNRDKHRAMHACFVEQRNVAARMRIGAGSTGTSNVSFQVVGFPRGGPSTTLAVVTAHTPDAEMGVDANIAVDVAITDGKQVVPFEELSVLRAETEAVLRCMAPHFA